MLYISRLDQARQAIRQVITDFLEGAGWADAASLVTVEVPTEQGHGDLTTSFALKIRSQTQIAPRMLLEKLAPHLDGLPMMETFEIAGPGFLNFTLKTEWLATAIDEARMNPNGYGNSDVGGGRRVLLEYVSANPTGPMVVVSGRAAAVGDTLARVMGASGFKVSREFYINDAGKQIVTLGQALALRLVELDQQRALDSWPDGVYPGEYVKDLAYHYRQLNPMVDAKALGEDDYPSLGSWAADQIRQAHEKTLSEFRVTFDRWYSERELRESGAPEKVIERLYERGFLVERDGARWFTSSQFGDDKDRVMVRSDGTLTYMVPDAAYHKDKFDRGFDYVIDLLGPDHHGYVNRMRAVVEALGYPPERLEIIIIQLVRLMRGQELVRMSKRGGTFVALEDLIEEAGVDPARFFFLERAPETPMDFDLNLATLKGSDNPVYYVQYVGARIHSILSQWWSMRQPAAAIDLTLLTAREERHLIVLVARFPDVIRRVALEREPQHLPKFLTELAQAFHSFYRQHRILDAEPLMRQARLALIEAVLVVTTRGLGLMGISQPEKM